MIHVCKYHFKLMFLADRNITTGRNSLSRPLRCGTNLPSAPPPTITQATLPLTVPTPAAASQPRFPLRRQPHFIQNQEQQAPFAVSAHSSRYDCRGEIPQCLCYFVQVGEELGKSPF